MKKLIAVIGLALASITTQAQTVTNTPLSFTNVTIEAYTGYQYEGNGGNNTALLGATLDIGSFQAGKLGLIDYGIGAEASIAATGPVVNTASLRVYFIKNVDTVQIYTFAGAGRDFGDSTFYPEFGVGVNYNLYRGQNWSSFIGTGIKFVLLGGKQMDYEPTVKTGIAF